MWWISTISFIVLIIAVIQLKTCILVLEFVNTYRANNSIVLLKTAIFSVSNNIRYGHLGHLFHTSRRRESPSVNVCAVMFLLVILHECGVCTTCCFSVSSISRRHTKHMWWAHRPCAAYHFLLTLTTPSLRCIRK